MTDAADRLPIPGLPSDETGPVFREPWEAQAFAMTVKLHAAGHFTWTEWARRLGAEIEAAGAGHDASAYYELWLRALEKLVAENGLLSADDLARRTQAWAKAARQAPHGQPIGLPPDAG